MDEQRSNDIMDGEMTNGATFNFLDNDGPRGFQFFCAQAGTTSEGIDVEMRADEGDDFSLADSSFFNAHERGTTTVDAIHGGPNNADADPSAPVSRPTPDARAPTFFSEGHSVSRLNCS